MFPTHYFRFTGEKYEKVCTMRADCDFRPAPCTFIEEGLIYKSRQRLSRRIGGQNPPQWGRAGTIEPRSPRGHQDSPVLGSEVSLTIIIYTLVEASILLGETWHAGITGPRSHRGRQDSPEFSQHFSNLALSPLSTLGPPMHEKML